MINHYSRRIAIAALTVFTLTGTVGAQQLSVEHAQGTTTVDANPEVVFSYDYASIDTLATLGVEVHGAPPLAGAAPDWLPSDLINVGSLFEPDYETINAEQPDLVIIGGRSAETYPEMSRLAPTVDVTFGSDFYSSLQANTRLLAEIFDKEAEAEFALSDIQARIDSLSEQVQSGGDGLLLMVSGGSLSLLSPNNARAGRGALLYQVLGLPPTIDDIESATHGEPVSFEFLLRYDPDWLFVIDRDAAVGTEAAQPAAAVLDNELMRQTSAWQNDRIVYLDAFNWYIITGAGLSSANAMLDEIEAAYSR